MNPNESLALRPTVLPAFTVNAVLVQIVLLASAALLLPAAAHLTGLPVRQLLPMHWPALFVGLCYGWRSGAVIGLLAPITSFLISGMPPAFMLPAMTVELAAYGFLAGFSREYLRLNYFLSMAVALVGGRIVFLGIALAFGSIVQPFYEYLMAAMLPGLPAAIAQLILLSLAARLWVGNGRSSESSDS